MPVLTQCILDPTLNLIATCTRSPPQADAIREALPLETLDLDPKESGDRLSEVTERLPGTDLVRSAR